MEVWRINISFFRVLISKNYRYLYRYNIFWSGGLTQGGVGGSSASVWDLLAVGVHAPTLSRAGVTLCGLVGAVLVALRDVLSDGRTRTEEREEAGS